MEKNNTGWWWALGVVVVILIIIAIVHADHNTAIVPTPAATTSTTNGDNSALTPTEDTSTGSVDAGAGAVTLSYANALIKYANARIQFDSTCAATPIQETFADHTNIMLDNRSANPLTLALGTMGDVTIKPWGFKIINFSPTLLPTNNVVTIDCNAQQNVAQITIQK